MRRKKKKRKKKNKNKKRKKKSGANHAQVTAQALAYNRKFTVIVTGQLNVEICSDLRFLNVSLKPYKQAKSPLQTLPSSVKSNSSE
jgi:hypothetical protein